MAAANQDVVPQPRRMPMVQQAGPLGPPRNTEGLVLCLYHHLWLKDQHGQSCPVNIPHTVLFQNSQPLAWYFTSLKSNTIMRKKRSNLKGPAMAEAFMAGRAAQPHVCAWFSGHMTELQSSARKAWSGKDEERSNGELAMEFLTYDRVQAILSLERGAVSREQLYDGVMQRFVEPRDLNDFVIRVLWSPTSCIFEKRVNKHRLDGVDGAPLADRVGSFNNGLWHHADVPIVEGVLQTRLAAQSSAIAAHVKDVTRGQSVIARMELFYKIDAHNSSLKLEAVPPLRVVYNRAVDGGAFVLKDPTRSEQVQADEACKDTFVCAVSGKSCPTEQRSQVTYQLIIQHWFKQCSELATDAERIQSMDSIPQALKRANPNMSRDYYLKHRAQPFFLASLADVGTEAALQLQQTAGADLAATIGRPLLPKASRPASASTAHHMSPAALEATSPAYFSLHSSVPPRRARPLSCSALAQPHHSGALLGSRTQPLHQWMTSTPGSAVVTPMSTGRVVSALPSRRQQQLLEPQLPQQPQQSQQSLQKQLQQKQQKQQCEAPCRQPGRLQQDTEAVIGAVGSLTHSLLPLTLVAKAASDRAQLKAQALKASYGSHTSAAPNPRGHLMEQSCALRPSHQPQLAPPEGSKAALPLPPGTIAEGAAAGAVLSQGNMGQRCASVRSGSPGVELVSGQGSSRFSPQRRQSPMQSTSPQRHLPSAGSFDPSTDGSAGPAAGQGGTLSSHGSRSSRHSIQSVLSETEVRTLKQLSDAYTEAEQLTQALLQQANQLLESPSGTAAAAQTIGAPPPAAASVRSAQFYAPSASGSGRQLGSRAAEWTALQSQRASKAGSVHSSFGADRGNPTHSEVTPDPTFGPRGAIHASGSSSLPPRPMSGRSTSASSVRPMSARPKSSLQGPSTHQVAALGHYSGVPGGDQAGGATGPLSLQSVQTVQTAPEVTSIALTPEEEEFLCEAIYE